MDMLFINYLIMRKYLLHVIIISFVFFITPTILAASDIERKIEELKQAIRINPDHINAHYNLGLAYNLSNDKDSALEQCEILKSLDLEMANKLVNEIYK